MKKDEITVDFEKRGKLEAVLGADHVAFCYQCGACVGDCPTARFHKGFNPREIMLKSLVGDIDELIEENSIIWLCSNCYNCYERCPQDVRPVEVIIALKNLAVQKGTSSKDIVDITERVKKTGFSVPIMASTNKLREELGLQPIKQIDTAELKKLLEKEPDK
jgi:heterodisulfide reductase subunit C2